jgi:hypothetical protein
MRNENLYKFLTLKCKQNGLPIESLPDKFGVSRSSLYRYMKGIVHMSPKVQGKFVHILGFDEDERQEFERLVGLAEFDSSLIAARYALRDFVFCKETGEQTIDNIKFAYHETDTFLRTSDEIFRMIEELASQQEASGTIRIINCLEERIIAPVSAFLERVFTVSENVEAEHLLAFSEKNFLQNANTLIDIIPLLKYTCYSVYHSASSATIDTKTLFGNSLMIDIRLKDGLEKYFFISFLNEDLSTCLATSDKSVFTFGLSNYEALKKSYHTALLDASNLDFFGDQIAEIQEKTNCYLMKPNCCYHRIPISVCKSLISRISEQDLKTVQNGISGIAGDGVESIGTLLTGIEKRMSSSYENHDIDVYSMDGLTQFAETGRITDHLNFLPSFNNQERKSILEYIRDRSSDSSDPYTLYITREEILANGHIIIALENLGVMIEYSQEDYRRGVCSNLFIRNKILADIMSDFVKNHIPDNHALSQNEACEFLNCLIDSLK